MALAREGNEMRLLPGNVRYLRNCLTIIILVLLSVVALAGQVFAINGVHTFASPGPASGGFKPVGNHFLVSAGARHYGA